MFNDNDVKKANEIGDVFNTYSIGAKTAEAFAETVHKTLMQTFLRFAFELIYYIGSGRMIRPIDDRNKASCDICKEIYEKAGEALEKGIPFI